MRASERLFDSVRLTAHSAQSDSTENVCHPESERRISSSPRDRNTEDV